jgi:hypothetical protein
MHAFWRYPALPVGVVLLVLGLGNWVASHGKIAEYERRMQEPDLIEGPIALDGFTHLTPRTNATLLERLHPHFGTYSVAAARRDFYTVVQSGGRIIGVIGLLLIGVGLLQRWRERRLQRAAPHSPIAPHIPVAGA